MVGLSALGGMSWIRTSRGHFWSRGKRDLPFHTILFIQFLLSQIETIERSERYGILGLVVCSDLNRDPCRKKKHPKFGESQEDALTVLPIFLCCDSCYSLRDAVKTPQKEGTPTISIHSGVSVLSVKTLVVFCPNHCSRTWSLLVSSQPRADQLTMFSQCCRPDVAHSRPFVCAGISNSLPSPKYPLVSYCWVFNLPSINPYGIVTSTSLPSAHLLHSHWLQPCPTAGNPDSPSAPCL